MGIATDAAIVYDDYNTSGVPASGKKKPLKADIRTLFATIEAGINALGGFSFASRTAAAAATIAAPIVAFSIAPTDAQAYFVREIANPGALQKYQFTTNGGTRWWQVAGRDLPIEAFDAKGDGTTDDQPAMVAAKTYFGIIGGGRLTFTGGKTYVCNAGAVNWNVDNMRIESIGGRAIIKRTALLTATAMWESRALTSTTQQNIVIRGFKFVHTDSQHITHTATAGQTTFAAALGSTSIFDYVVMKNSTLLSPANGEYSYSSSNIVLTVAAALNDSIVIKRTSASARSAALLDEGFSATSLSYGVRFEDIEVESDGSLYVGVEHIWAQRGATVGLKVTGVANRGHYRYGRLFQCTFDDITVSGLAISGPLSGVGKKVTDYTYDLNAYDTSNQQTECFEGTVKVSYGYRGPSLLGGFYGCVFGDYHYDQITTYGLLLQDSPSVSATDRISFKSVRGIGATSISVYITCSRIHFDFIDVVSGSNHGIYFLPGTSGSSESDISIGRAVVSSMNGVGLYLQTIIYARVDSIQAIGNANTGIYLDGCQYADIGGTSRGNTAGGGVLINATSSRNNLRVQSIGNTGTGVSILAGASLNTVEGRSQGNTTNLSDLGTTSDVARLRLV